MIQKGCLRRILIRSPSLGNWTFQILNPLLLCNKNCRELGSSWTMWSCLDWKSSCWWEVLKRRHLKLAYWFCARVFHPCTFMISLSLFQCSEPVLALKLKLATSERLAIFVFLSIVVFQTWHFILKMFTCSVTKLSFWTICVSLLVRLRWF